VPNSTPLWKLLKIAEFRTPTPQDIRKKCSKILKLPPVRNCFTLAITNKLVVVINSLKVPKIKKILLYEMKFLVPNYSCLQKPCLGGYRPQIPVLSVLSWICWAPPPNKIPGYATGQNHVSSQLLSPLLMHNVWLSCILFSRAFMNLGSYPFPLVSFFQPLHFTLSSNPAVVTTYYELSWMSYSLLLGYNSCIYIMIANHKTYSELIYNSSVFFPPIGLQDHLTYTAKGQIYSWESKWS